MIEPIKQLVRELENERDPDAAAAMSSYMRDQFPFLGVRTPLRKQILKAFLAANPPDKKWIPLLWEMPEREFQYCGLDIALSLRKKLVPADLPMIETCIVSRSWWDTVDLLASNAAGFLLHKYPQLQADYGEKWLRSGNMWLNRTAILFQLHYKEATDEALLYSYIREHASSGEFFIQKAIGWALREYSKTNPASVVAFIEHEELKPLSRREGMKWLNRPGKIQ
ncbi:DNA alkylation repair protein [Paenibacillus rhizophilus]|uniref:DNA alkylation repair protein n=1 Tax=Paenibacillus rhizophilus TaxID=1850366 RepID=A0A3N9Q884_9BACL|nr:DNA alkylation repair protein [Paenibacillus rhizophilus]RQW13736.1 DNA alkylation repair protein [Paenibacillus rhizophilus]